MVEGVSDATTGVWVDGRRLVRFFFCLLPLDLVVVVVGWGASLVVVVVVAILSLSSFEKEPFLTLVLEPLRRTPPLDFGAARRRRVELLCFGGRSSTSTTWSLARSRCLLGVVRGTALLLLLLLWTSWVDRRRFLDLDFVLEDADVDGRRRRLFWVEEEGPFRFLVFLRRLLPLLLLLVLLRPPPPPPPPPRSSSTTRRLPKRMESVVWRRLLRFVSTVDNSSSSSSSLPPSPNSSLNKDDDDDDDNDDDGTKGGCWL